MPLQGSVRGFQLVLAALLATTFCFRPSALATVYSLNAVGYVNVELKPGWNLISAPLFLNQPSISGLFNPSTIPAGVTVIRAHDNGFEVNNYLDGWTNPDMPIYPGRAYFVYNPEPNSITLVITGGVEGGPTTTYLSSGYSLAASIHPVGWTLSQMNLVPEPGARAYLWSQSLQRYERFHYATEWLPFDPLIAVSEGFWVYSASALVWEQDALDLPLWAPGVISTLRPVSSDVPEVNFLTYNRESGFGRVLDADGVRPLNHEFNGQLYASFSNSEFGLMPLGKPVRFLSGDFAGYVRGTAVKVPGAAASRPVYLQLRVWEAAAGPSYEAAYSNGGKHGKSALFAVEARAPIQDGEPGYPPLAANGFPNFSVGLAEQQPRFTAIVVEGTRLRFHCLLPPGAEYEIVGTDQFAAPQSWQLATEVQRIAGADGIVEVAGPAVSSTHRFFRIRQRIRADQ